MAEKKKVLLIGAAFSADLHMEGYDRCKDLARVVAICDKNLERVHALAERYHLEEYEIYEDYKTAIDQTDCDAVDICLPNFLHCEVALYAFARGRHVICEKPLAVSVEEAERMIRASEAAGKHLYYAEDWLFAPAIHRARAILEEGAIGEMKMFRARECHSGSHSPFAKTIRYCGGGAMIHLGVHPVGLALALKNNEWVSVIGNVTGGNGANLVHTDMEGEDFAGCIVTFKDGTKALLEANFLTVGGMEDIIDIYGTKGCLHVDINFSSAVRCFSVPGVSYTIEKAELTKGWSAPAVDEKYNLGYVDEIRHFMACLHEDREAKVGLRGKDGLEALYLIQAIYRSAKEGKVIYNPVYLAEKG